MRFFYKFWSWLTGRNAKNTPVSVISEQMNESRQLPLGSEEFEIWSDRIISGVPLLNAADKDSLKFALATMILHLGPQESHKADLYFLKSLLKSAANQVAQAKMTVLRDAAKARLASEDAAKAEAANDKAAVDATLKRIEDLKDIKARLTVVQPDNKGEVTSQQPQQGNVTDAKKSKEVLDDKDLSSITR